VLLDLNQRVCQAWDREWPARRPRLRKRAAEITFLDPACGSGHFLLEAFDLLYDMYREEDSGRSPEEISAAILNHNLNGVDIDERAIQIAYAALWIHARQRAPNLSPALVTDLRDHLVAANVALPAGRARLDLFLADHPDDAPLAPALEVVLHGLTNASELGSLLLLEAPVEKILKQLKAEEDQRSSRVLRAAQGKLGFLPEQYVLEEPRDKRDYQIWKREVLARLKDHFNVRLP